MLLFPTVPTLIYFYLPFPCIDICKEICPNKNSRKNSLAATDYNKNEEFSLHKRKHATTATALR